MKHKISLVACPLLLASLPGLASAHTLDLPITTAKETNAVSFRSVRLEHDATGQHVIKGQLHRLARAPVHFGHLDYAVVDQQGKTLETGQASYTSAIRLRHVYRPSYFSIAPNVELNQGDTVQLCWSADPMHGNGH
jgi:hypothetical protein